MKKIMFLVLVIMFYTVSLLAVKSNMYKPTLKACKAEMLSDGEDPGEVDITIGLIKSQMSNIIQMQMSGGGGFAAMFEQSISSTLYDKCPISAKKYGWKQK